MIKDITYYQHCIEWQIFDRKSIKIALKDLAILLCAFANADGGDVVIGIEDNGEITGVDNAMRKVNELQRVALDYCVPSIQSTSQLLPVIDSKGGDNHILLIHVQPSMLVHATQADDVYYRVGDKSKRLTFDQRSQLVFAKGNRYFEDTPIINATLEDLDNNKISAYCEKLGYDKGVDCFIHENGFISKQVDYKGVMQEYPTSAAILLFGKNPQLYFQRAQVRVLRYNGDEEHFGSQMNLIKDKTFVGTIDEVALRAIDFVSTQIEEHTFLGKDGQFVTIPQYPEFCWTEMIVNAITHRDYSILGTDIQVKLFDNHFMVESPGILPGMVRINNIREMHFSRNPKIARFMQTMGLVKELGEGVDRIYREMAAVGNPEPHYEMNDCVVRAHLYQPTFVSETEKFAPEVEKFAPEIEKFAPIYANRFDKTIATLYVKKAYREKAANDCWKIVQTMIVDGAVSAVRLSECTGLSLRTVKKHIKSMQQAGIVTYVRKEGLWKVLLEKINN